MQGKNKGFWLDDDPEWKALSDRVNKRPAPKLTNKKITAQQPIPHKTTPKISSKKLKLSLNLTIPKPKMPSLPRQKKYLVVGVVGLGIIIGVGSLVLSSGKKTSTDSKGVLSDNAQQPDYDILLPMGEKKETASGKIGYDPSKKVASFTDTIGHINITISQQPLPESFKTDPDASVEKLAQEFSAHEVINESNPKAYIGTSAQGPQTVIFHKSDVLVFIHSSGELDKESWAAYVTQLL